MSKDEKLYDVRVVERYIKEGMLTDKNYEGYVKKLPDVTEKGETLIIDEEEVIEESIEGEALEAEGDEGTEIE